jgi:hypothetical protein
MTTGKIIENALNKLNTRWYCDKKEEFMNSPFREEDFLFNNDKVYRDKIDASFDKETGDFQISSIKKLEVPDVDVDITLLDFVINSKDYYEKVYKRFYQDGNVEFHPDDSTIDPRLLVFLDIKKIDDITTLAKKLAIEVYQYFEKNIDKESVIKFSSSASDLLASKLDDHKFEIDIADYKTPYFDTFNNVLSELTIDKVESIVFNKSDEGLRFDLNLEQITSLLNLLSKANFFDSEEELKVFAVKYFKIKDSLGNYTDIDYHKFKDRFNKQSNKTHRISALNKIKDDLFASFDKILESKGE